MERTSAKSCPSAQPDMEEARIFAVRSGTAEAPRIAYLDAATPVDDAMLASLGAINPTEVFRFAARCEESACSHFDGKRCTLAQRLGRALAPVTDSLPPCTVRPTCRWYAEEGGAICRCCPQIITLNLGSDDDQLRRAATPP